MWLSVSWARPRLRRILSLVTVFTLLSLSDQAYEGEEGGVDRPVHSHDAIGYI
jgi:hypothetical protein